VSGDEDLIYDFPSFDEGSEEMLGASEHLSGAAGESAGIQGRAGAQLRQWLPTAGAADTIDDVEATADTALSQATDITGEDAGKLLTQKQNMLDTEHDLTARIKGITPDARLPDLAGSTDAPAEIDEALPGSQGYVSPRPGSPEYEVRLNELAQDPAHNGAINAKSLQEARVGLEAEANGTIPGPIRRAPFGPDGEDQGEFIDADEQRWDVKSSPDVQPSTSRRPGQPIPNPQSTQEFSDMINNELDRGENVLLDSDGMTPERLAQLKAITDHNPAWQGKVAWAR
jgi:hypothetical protein